ERRPSRLSVAGQAGHLTELGLVERRVAAGRFGGGVSRPRREPHRLAGVAGQPGEPGLAGIQGGARHGRRDLRVRGRGLGEPAVLWHRAWAAAWGPQSRGCPPMAAGSSGTASAATPGWRAIAPTRSGCGLVDVDGNGRVAQPATYVAPTIATAAARIPTARTWLGRGRCGEWRAIRRGVIVVGVLGRQRMREAA